MAETVEFGRVLESPQEDVEEFGRVIEASPSKKQREPVYSKKRVQRAARQALTGALKYFQSVGGRPYVPSLEDILSGADLRDPGIARVEGPKEDLDFKDKLFQGIGHGVAGAPAAGLGLIRGGLSGAGQVAGEEVGGPIGGIIGGLLPIVAPGTSVPFQGELGAGAPPYQIKPVGAAQKATLATIRRHGGDEKALSVFFKPKIAVKTAAALGKKTARSGKYGAQLKESVGRLYDSIEQGFKNEGSLLPGQQRSIARKFRKLEKQLTRKLAGKDLKEVAQIIEDVRDPLLRPGATAEELPVAWQKLNDSIPWHKIRKGKKLRTQAGKKILFEEMNEINPSLANDTLIANELYGSAVKLSEQLTPKAAGTFKTLMRDYPILKGLVYVNLSSLPQGAALFAAEEGGRRALTRYITSPRTQGMLTRMIDAVNQNKQATASALARQIERELEELTQKEKPTK